MQTRVNYYDIEVTKDGKYSVGAVLLKKQFKYFFHPSEFVEWIQTIRNHKIIYIHNLKYDIEFHFTELFKAYTPLDDRKAPVNISFTIDKMNNIYGVHIKQYGIKVDILDYFKLMPFKLETIGETVGYSKLKIDYQNDLKDFQSLKEVPAHVLKYLRRDCLIMQKSYEKLPKMKIKNTIASTSYENWRKIYQKPYVYQHFTKHLKGMPLNYLRNWYRGGIVLHDETKKYQNLGRVHVYDFNSLYPSVMLKSNLPYGNWSSTIPDTKSYLTLLEIKIKSAYAKYIPWYNINGLNVKEFKDTIIYVTDKEWKLFQASYLISHYEIIDKIYFATKWSFHKYIHFWYNYKKNATNQVDYRFAKLMLNSLYGKFGQNHIREIKVPIQQNTKIIGNYNGWEFVTIKKETRPKFYLPLAIAICAEARCKFLEFYIQHHNDIVYGDTDSFFSTVKYDYNSNEIGELKYEGHYDDFILVRKKGYIYRGMDKLLKFKLSGFRHNKEGQLSENMMHLKSKKIQDGYILEETPFVINNFQELPLDKLN